MFTYNLRELRLIRKMFGSQNNIDNTDQPTSQLVIFSQVCCHKSRLGSFHAGYSAVNQEETSGIIVKPPFLG